VETPTAEDATPQADEGATNFSAECGVGRMNNNYDTKLWAVLERAKLGDLSQFHRQGFFDEVPLYSRESEVGFLRNGVKEDEVLLSFALRFLRSVIAFDQHRDGYFAAITVWDFSDALLVPNLFVWCGPVGVLEAKLVLRKVDTEFGKRISALVPRLGLATRFSVLEDTHTDPDTARVFIAPRDRPYQGFLTLDHFRSRAVTSK
jgi:hypothetical protein